MRTKLLRVGLDEMFVSNLYASKRKGHCKGWHGQRNLLRKTCCEATTKVKCAQSMGSRPTGYIYDESKTGNEVTNAQQCLKIDADECIMAVASCGTDKTVDTTKLDEPKGSTPETTCCKAKQSCAGFTTCPAGKKWKANGADQKCPTDTCSENDCCDVDATKCLGLL